MSAESSKVLTRISMMYSTLRDAEKKVADYVLNNPAKARYLPLPLLSDEVEVSQSSIVRFCKALGFGGFSEFKVALVEDMAAQGVTDPAGAAPYSDISAEDDLETLVNKVIRLDANAIHGMLDILDLAAFNKAAEDIIAAERVEVIGVGSSLPVVMDLQYRLLRSGVDARLAVDSHMQSINCALLSASDVCVAVSYSGETRDTLESAEIAKAAGARIIAVTNFPKSRLAEIADALLLTASQRSSWIDDALAGRIVQLALFDALCVAITRRKSVDKAQRLSAIKKAIIIKHGR